MMSQPGPGVPAPINPAGQAGARPTDPDPTGLTALTATEAARRIREGEFTSEDLVRDCLERIERLEDAVRAWAFLDPDYALDQARKADEVRRSGAPLGPLHGVPVGVKDIFDTEDMPTENGTALHKGRQPNRNARAVELLREAGAVVLGKTVTTELAVYAPGKTRNPHDQTRTPGGSSSGSAAAVAAYMAPLALGTQTNGSVIRPAAYCGVCGFKPSHGSISRTGVLKQSPPLDQVGTFARTVEDIALVTEALMAFDDRDPDMRPHARPRLLETAMAEPAVRPVLMFVRTPVWDQADDDTKEAFTELVDALGDDAEDVELPKPFDRALEWHRTLMHADLAKNFAAEYEGGKSELSENLRDMIEEGRKITAVEYNRALEWREVLNTGLDEVFAHCDAIITPATTGEAPVGLETTGSPVFCSLWTLCGTPAITLPLLQGSNGMPMGVQLVGPRGDDARLLRTARWLVERLEGAG